MQRKSPRPTKPDRSSDQPVIAGETFETESLTAELDDLDEAEDYTWERIDLSLLTNPVVLRAILGVLVALAVLLWPERTDIVLARLVGLGLIALSLTTLLSVPLSFTSTPRNRWPACT